MMLDAKNTLADTLRQIQAEKAVVELFTKGGQAFKGRVASLSEVSIVLDPLSGKDFFAVLILLSEIAAISIQVRN